jgi:hypothetical protein
MHVDWSWIRQRPHFLATELASYFDVHVGYCKYYRKRNLVANERDERIVYTELWRIPARLTEVSSVARLNEEWLSRQVRSLLRNGSTQYVWISSPTLYAPAAKWLDGRKLIYDCMDDCGGFGSDRARQRALDAERALLGRADLVLVSSARLGEVVTSRGYSGAPLLVNNALAPHLLGGSASPRTRSARDPFVLLYFGTIGYWFDFSAMLAVLDRFPAVRLVLAGPAEVPLPEHPRIEYLGPVPHKALSRLAASCDALVMPFIVNDLIRGVDPVKVYEYIALGRNIVVPDYPEIRKFGGLVLTYASAGGLRDVVAELLRDNAPRYTEAQARGFLSDHTWSSRARQVVRAIERI